MLLYNAVFIFLMMLSFLEHFSTISFQYKKVICFAISVVYVVLSTIYKGGMGDYQSYELFFNAVNSNAIGGLVNIWFEPLYTAFNYAVALFTDSFIAFRFFASGIVMFLWYKVYTYAENPMIRANTFTIMALFWALGFGHIYVTRSTISIAICIFSLRYVMRRDLNKFIICVIIATGIHIMSLSWLPVYFIYSFRTKKTLRITVLAYIFVIALSQHINVLFTVFGHLLGGRIERSIGLYVGADLKSMMGFGYDMRFTVIKGIANVALLVIIFAIISRAYMFRMVAGYEGFDGIFNIYLIGTILYVVAMPVSIGLTRAAVPYIYMSYFLLPHAFNVSIVKKDVGSKAILFFVFFMYVLLRFYMNLGNGVEEYSTIFS